ncbi:MAG: glycosyltransferase family 9 protein [Desulfurobacteriaceae bacterium]
MKILLIQLKQLGDVLLSSPLAKALKDNLKDVTVHFLTSPLGKEVLEGNPFIDKILTLKNGILEEIKMLFSIRRENYDAIIDIQRTGRSKRITLLSGANLRIAFRKSKENIYYNRTVDERNRIYTVWDRLQLLKPLGIDPKVENYYPEFFLNKEEIEKGKSILQEYNLSPYSFFIITPTSRRINRAWQPEKFGILGNMLYETTGLIPFVTYAPGEETFAKRTFEKLKKGIILKNPLSIRMFAALIHFSKFLLGNDSFASHLAFSLRRKTFVILGPNEGWFPNDKLIVKIRKGLDCQPCNDWKSCRKKLECFKTLTPEEAFSYIVKNL